jgi:hypothetical protein
MEFYLAIKKNEITLFVAKWMKLENIILSEVARLKMSKVPCFPLYVEARPVS